MPTINEAEKGKSRLPNSKSEDKPLPRNTIQYKYSDSFQKVYPPESRLPMGEGILKDGPRKSTSERHSSGHGSSSDDSNTSFDQPTTCKVSMEPSGESNRRSNISQVSSDVSSGDSYTISPNTSTDSPGISNTGYERTVSSPSSAEENNSQDGSGGKKNVTFTIGVLDDNHIGKPKRSRKAKIKTPPPKYRRPKAGKENGAVPIQGQNVLGRSNSLRSKIRSSGRRQNSDGKHTCNRGRAPTSRGLKTNAGHAKPTYMSNSPGTSDVLTGKCMQESSLMKKMDQTSPTLHQNSPQSNLTSMQPAYFKDTSPSCGQNKHIHQDRKN